MDVKIEATVATMDVLVSRIRVVVAVIVEIAGGAVASLVSIFTFLSRGNTSQNAVSPDHALFEGPEALV